MPRRSSQQMARDWFGQEIDSLHAAERRVVEAVAQRQRVTQNLNRVFDAQLTVGQRLADRVAAFGGSWPFIIIFGGVLLVWVGLNTFLLRARAFDPYPYILLNLVLSMLAAIQAPIIMMSQNRQAAKDRLDAQQDYQINLKAELEIIALHEKLDELRARKWEELMALQRQQLEHLARLETR